jgi:hypothetical protein
MEGLFRKIIFRGIIYSLIFFQASSLIGADRPADPKGKGKAKGLNLQNLIGPDLYNNEDGGFSPYDIEAAAMNSIADLYINTPIDTQPRPEDGCSTAVSVQLSSSASPEKSAGSPLNSIPKTNLKPSSPLSNGTSGSTDELPGTQTRRSVSFAPEPTTKQQDGQSSQLSQSEAKEDDTSASTSPQQAGPSSSDETTTKYQEKLDLLRRVLESQKNSTTRIVHSEYDMFSGDYRTFLTALKATAQNGPIEMMNYLLSFIEFGYKDATVYNTASPIFYCHRDFGVKSESYSLIGQVLESYKYNPGSLKAFIEIIFSTEYLKLRNYSGEAVITAFEVEIAMDVVIQQTNDTDLLQTIFYMVLNGKDADRKRLITTETIDSITKKASEVGSTNFQTDFEKMRAEIVNRDRCCTIL